MSGQQMRMQKSKSLCGCALAVVMAVSAAAQSPSTPTRPESLRPGASLTPQTYKGLEISVTGVERATNVSLTDCPPGANSVRGVIRPGDTNEFVSVKVDFKVTPAFKPTEIAKPVLYDEAGKAYNTAQSFAEIGSAPTFWCTFAFRVPKDTKVKRFAIDTLSIDLSSM
jgi:hypothetical protein